MMKRAEGHVVERVVRSWTGEDLYHRRITSKSAAAAIQTPDEIMHYNAIIADISAMPRAVYFPIVARILSLLDKAFDPASPQNTPRFYVMVSEDPTMDQRIRSLDIDEDAGYIHGFGAAIDAESTSGTPKVWMPLLGEGHDMQLKRVWQLVNPSEICPVLPSPSRDPRRADNILAEYRELLFDRWRVEPKNILFGSEQNPFDVYRQLVRSSRQYSTALTPIGGCKVVFSAHSSKLTSLGALLAAYQLRQDGLTVGLAHVEPKSYDFRQGGLQAEPASSDLVSMRLA
jgi:hypothetical protein